MKGKKAQSKKQPKNQNQPSHAGPGADEIVNRHAAGIDCGAREHYAAVPPDSVEQGEPIVRSFSAFTQGLDALVEWFKVCGSPPWPWNRRGSTG